MLQMLLHTKHARKLIHILDYIDFWRYISFFNSKYRFLLNKFFLEQFEGGHFIQICRTKHATILENFSRQSKQSSW